MTRTTITGNGRPLPNLTAFGLKWRSARKLIEEQGELWQRQRELGREQVALTDEVRRLKDERLRERAAALRSGSPEPSTDAIEEAETRLAAVEEELAVVRLASERSHADLLKAVAEHREEWDAEVKAAGLRVLEEAQGIADALSAKLRQAEALGGLHEWLESGGERFGIPVGAAVSIEALVHERRRALGLAELEAGVIG